MTTTSYAAGKHAARAKAAEEQRTEILRLHGENMTPKQISQTVQVPKREVLAVIAAG